MPVCLLRLYYKPVRLFFLKCEIAAEIIALAASRFARLHDTITYTIVGMMVVTFGYFFENLLADKKNFPHMRKIIVVAIFAVVLLVYWLLKFI